MSDSAPLRPRRAARFGSRPAMAARHFALLPRSGEAEVRLLPYRQAGVERASSPRLGRLSWPGFSGTSTPESGFVQEREMSQNSVFDLSERLIPRSVNRKRPAARIIAWASFFEATGALNQSESSTVRTAWFPPQGTRLSRSQECRDIQG